MNFVDHNSQKKKEEVENNIEEIKKELELEQKDVDTRVEDIIGEENNGGEGNLQQKFQVESDLVNTRESLEKRGKELNFPGCVNDYTEKLNNVLSKLKKNKT